MNFTQAVDEVKATVKRPELIATIRREVNAAISFYCLDNHFARDFIEQQVVIDPNEYTQSFALSTLTRFRAFDYIKRAGTKAFLKKLDKASQEAGCIESDKYYIAGANCNISMITKAAALDVGYHSYPPLLSDGSPEFWLLEVAPYMIIERALSTLFKSIGDEKSFQASRASSAELYMAARKDLINN